MKRAPAGFSAAAIIQLFARLRMVCESIGVEPADANLDDLSSGERHRFLRLATADYWNLIEGGGGDE